MKRIRTPLEIYTKGFVDELQQTLMRDDCYLPFYTRRVSALTSGAVLLSDMENAQNLRNGIDREVGDTFNYASGVIGCYAEYQLNAPSHVHNVRLVLDSDLNLNTLPERERNLGSNLFMRSNILLGWELSYPPKTLLRDPDIIYTLSDGTVITEEVRENHQRLLHVPCDKEVPAIRLVPLSTWGSRDVSIYAFDLEEK